MGLSYLVMYAEESPRYEGAPTTTPFRVSTVPLYVPIVGGRVGAVPTFKGRDDELRGNLSPTPAVVDGYNPAGGLSVQGYADQGIPLCYASGLIMTATQGNGTNAVQTITKGGTVSGGTWTVTILTTLIVAGIPYNATAAEIQALIDDKIRRMMGASPVKLGDIVVAGGPVSTTPVTLTYQGYLSAQVVALCATDATLLTGAAPTLTPSTSTPGVVGTTLLPDGTGLPTSAYRWTTQKATALDAQTMQIIAAYGDASAYEKGQGFACNQLSIGDDGSFASTWLGLVAGGAVDPALTPSYQAIAVEPMMAKDRLVTWAGGGGNISTFEAQISNPVLAEKHNGIRSAFPGKMRYNTGFVNMTGSVTMDNFDPTDRDNFMEATTFALRSHWKTRSKIGSTGALYQVFVDAPACQLSGGTGAEELAAKRRHGASYEWSAFYDPTATHPDGTTGYDFAVTFTSGLSTFKTFV